MRFLSYTQLAALSIKIYYILSISTRNVRCCVDRKSLFRHSYSLDNFGVLLFTNEATSCAFFHIRSSQLLPSQLAALSIKIYYILLIPTRNVRCCVDRRVCLDIHTVWIILVFFCLLMRPPVALSFRYCDISLACVVTQSHLTIELS